MNRSLPGRLLLVLLAVALQVALLPAQGRFRCMLRSASLTGCCCVTTVAPSTSPSGCCHAKPGERVDPQPRMGGRCTCGADAAGLLVISEPIPSDGVAAKKADVDDVPQMLLPGHLGEPVVAAFVPPAALRAPPPACAGPPLHVRLQVFLI